MPAEARMSPGFADPVHDAQGVFRTLLECMSRPGSLLPCPTPLDSPPRLLRTTAALVLSLLDSDTPTWLDDSLDTAEIRAYLRFHCAVPLVTDPARARFALIGAPDFMPDLVTFAQGSEHRPDESVTLVLQLPSLTGGAPYQLVGPGIETRATVRFNGLPQRFWAQWRANHSRFPLGVDLILVDAQHLAGLPRTARRS